MIIIIDGQICKFSDHRRAWVDSQRFKVIRGYLVVMCPKATDRRQRLVHRVIAGAKDNDGTHVHHINHDKLDNQDENLIVLTPSQHRQRHKTDLDLSDACDIARIDHLSR